MTWLLVNTRPDSSKITPVPLPKPTVWRPKRSWLTIRVTIETTAGRTLSTVSAMLGSCSMVEAPSSLPTVDWELGMAVAGSGVAVEALEQATAANKTSIKTAIA